jgi:uncharacterized protein YcsI (UPF0317 family)
VACARWRAALTATRSRRQFQGIDAGLTRGNVQAHLVILPRDLVQDFLDFTVANPKSIIAKIKAMSLARPYFHALPL